MQTFKDIRIHNVVKRKNKDIFLTLHIKKEDISRELEDFLFDACDDWDIFVLALQKADFKNTEAEVKTQRNKDLIYLNVLMTKYSEKEWTTLAKQKQTVYDKCNVSSRAMLNDKQLREVIDSYKFGLYN